MTFENWKTFLFMDEENGEYCGRHNVKRVKMTSKLGDTTIGKGFVCPKCEITLIDGGNEIIIRKDDKWIPIKEYAKQLGVTI